MPPMAHFSNRSEELTTMWCDTRRPENLRFPTLHRPFNHTATSPPTAINFLPKRESKRMKKSTTMANHDPRMNRTNPKYRALLGIVGTWSTSHDFCNCLLFALCVLDSVLQLSCVLLECVLYHVLMIELAFQPYKPLWHVKPPNRKTSLKCGSLPSFFISSSIIGKFRVKF
jgi:hypothetical protein